MYIKLTKKHKKQVIKDVDRSMAIVAVIQPLMATPQILTIYGSRSATNVALSTWLMFSVLGVVSLVYAIIHRIKPYIITQILWTIIDIIVVVGILKYS